ncbi:hypothetical protein SUGI_0367800 [Cryptomeria japonica]|uniref:disease resistance RPP13-like protein 4 n=1 Tax=Cryptomeria japonica TaxID=3369 RepID=UPI002408EB86|nr:disease resistance RPP13-like protein 4 [Cryptomeria japonica]GLJ20253.1 hypothetical protein SUGI_0367800 [Cryptomeria japonica]
MEHGLVNVVVGKFGEYNQASIALNFRKELEWLKQKLRRLRSYLREIDIQSAQNGNAKSWLLDVEELALDAEDILDECAVESKGTNYEISQLSCLCAFSYSQLVFRFKMAHRIKGVKDRLRSIMEAAAELKLFHDLIHSDQPSTSTSRNVKWKRTNLMEKDSKPVGIEPKVKEILRLLDNSAAPVIALVGMGGVGKTFLLQNVFNRVKDKFENSIWLEISQTYSLRELQADLASNIKLNEVVKGVSEIQATELIHERLASTRALIVLDDVWRATEEDNLISSLGLPRGKNSQCKILISTRSRLVCRNMNAHVYEVHTLSEEESWTLFCAFAFPDCHQNQPPEQLEGIARQIEEECGRLPLVVKTVAASLARKRSLTVWESKLGQIRVPSYTKDPIMQVLKLSYDSLPAHLKPCFAFLSFFPENEEIDPHYLINLWAAEGYVPQGEDQLDIGLSYIYDLYNLCLVERTGDIYDQVDKRFKLNDLMLDLAISISRESKCAFSVEETLNRGPSMQTSSRYRRILLGKKSIGDDDVEVMARNRGYSASCLRTLSFSQDIGIQNIPAMLLSDVRVLRILDLSDTNISSLPTCVGNLRLLKVLNLRGTKITKVPKCIRSNKNLRFLDISSCHCLQQLPQWIGELNCLEHLDISGINSMPKGISNLVSLQVLRLDFNNCKLSIEKNEFFQLEDYVYLINLREVSIVIHHEAELKTMEKGRIFAVLVKMRSLNICNASEGHVDECNLPSLPEEMLAMKNLEFLCLDSFAVSNWICGFSNLMQLRLYNCHCAEYPALELMPSLINLELNFNDNCKALPKGFGKRRGFLQLHVFKILNFPVLEELPDLEDGAMPHLEILEVFQCPYLKKVPSGLGLLKSLKECEFIWTGISIPSIREEDEELWNKIKVNNSSESIYLG